jgi:hypothetical protein
MNLKILCYLLFIFIPFSFGCSEDDLPAEPMISGIAVDYDGKRVSSATILVVNAAKRKQTAIGRTDSNGRFAIQVEFGTYQVYARKEKMEGITQEVTLTSDQLTSKITILLYEKVNIRTLCQISEEERNQHQDKKDLIAAFSTQKFRELGIREGDLVKVINASYNRDIVVYALHSDAILCEMSAPRVILQKLLPEYLNLDKTPISVYLEVSIASPELFR